MVWDIERALVSHQEMLGRKPFDCPLWSLGMGCTIEKVLCMAYFTCSYIFVIKIYIWLVSADFFCPRIFRSLMAEKVEWECVACVCIPCERGEWIDIGNTLTLMYNISKIEFDVDLGWSPLFIPYLQSFWALFMRMMASESVNKHLYIISSVPMYNAGKKGFLVIKWWNRFGVGPEMLEGREWRETLKKKKSILRRMRKKGSRTARNADGWLKILHINYIHSFNYM